MQKLTHKFPQFLYIYPPQYKQAKHLLLIYTFTTKKFQVFFYKTSTGFYLNLKGNKLEHPGSYQQYQETAKFHF